MMDGSMYPHVGLMTGAAHAATRKNSDGSRSPQANGRSARGILHFLFETREPHAIEKCTPWPARYLPPY
jgi:hypothetical protein